MSSALSSLPLLEELCLPRTISSAFEWLAGVAAGARTLTSLSLHGAQQTCPWGISVLSMGLPNLTRLDLSSAPHLSDDALAHLHHLRSLRDLNVSGAIPRAIPRLAMPWCRPPNEIQRFPPGCPLLISSGLRHLSLLPLTRLAASDCTASSNPVRHLQHADRC